ncbi:MAG: Hsp70 family protein [Lachnospiraceae bacterium]|nr:Hsp70 family protein [Lachnospiraceae bacterium]
MQEHNDLCVGIDLGTTNSVLATINEKPNGDVVSKVVEISRGVDMYNAVSGEAKLTTMKKPTLPSCIYYRQEKNYEPLVGDFAKMQYPLRPHLVAKSIKSQMGKPFAEGLSSDIPDKTPAQISSRILKHMLKEASKVYRCDITDAVITVPANFDSAMCKATRDAAELAGIKVKNADGTERPVLLSEPNAVIYDMINQIHNGEISSRILDLSEKKRVLVFDLGGGTLDITMHEIKRRDDNADVLKVDEIATNRYTLLGGDDFDEEIAKAMYIRYINQFSSHPDVVSKLKKEEKVIMAQLRVYAEHLKLELNERCGDDYNSGWDDPDDEIEIPTGGNMGGIGYSYDDTFSKDEVEDILSVFMAKELSYEDYKRIDRLSNTRNIIYPILDVLKKAADKLGTQDVVVDAVIVNGGMSKFYMVTDRLKDFFGFEPIVALDPDQAVARGAAVYHYYLHKYEEMREDMKLLGNTDSVISEASSPFENTQANTTVESRQPVMPSMAIQWGNSILNDCLYLGVKNGAVHEIIPTGAELPYTSNVMTGFRVEPGQNMIAIPIKSQNLDGSYRIIANGNISFKQSYHNGAYVAFQIYMGSSKVINMKAWTSKDVAGTEKIEEGYAEISIDNSEKLKVKAKFLAPSGSKLQPKSEVNNMLQLCQNYERCKNKQEKSNISKRIAASVSSICNAGNKSEFAEVVLDALQSVSSEEPRQRLFTIARKIGSEWSESEKRRLAMACMSQISADINGFSMRGPKTSTNIQAIYTLSICANMDQLTKLSALHESTRYLQACLYTHAKTRSDLQWLQDEFESDVSKSKKGLRNNIQFSSYAIGVALRKDGISKGILSAEAETKIVKKLCEVVQMGNLTSEELTCCLLALGWICDQREYSSEISGSVIQEVFDTIRSVDDYYSVLTAMKQAKAREIAIKMVNGDLLNVDEEQFLLTKLEQ